MTKTIAVILGDISNPHFSILVKEIERTARTDNYTTIILNTDENDELEREAINSALSKKVDGIILCPTQKSKENIFYLMSTSIPFILIGRYFKDIETDYVVCDDTKGGYLATKYLINKGHVRILFLNGPKYISSAAERYEGYKKALSESGVEYDNALVREISITSGSNKRIIKKVITDEVKFTAIFAFSDMIAWETAHALNEFGYKIPGDIDIVGFDNIQSKLMFPPKLTSIKTNISTMSKRAVAVLLMKINKKDTGLKNEVIDVEVEIRN